MSDMIERTAHAISRAELQWSIDNEGYGGSVNSDCPSEVKARAAIAIVIEEFAIIADDQIGDPDDADNAGGNYVARYIANIIRSALDDIDTQRELDRLAATPM